MGSNIAIKTLINKFGLPNKLKFENDSFLSIHKIPNHYNNYKRLTLYFGDWRRIKSDCVYVDDKKELERLLVLLKIGNVNIPKDYNIGLHDEGLIECADYVKNFKFIYFGNLNNFTPRDDLKSLLVPIDLLNNKTSNDINSLKSLGNTLENFEIIDKIVLSTIVNDTWIYLHKFLKYQY